MERAICVFSSSSDVVDPVFFEVASELGALIAQRHYTLIYGGATVGLMGALATAVHDHGGKVVGIIPAPIRDRGIAYEPADELIVTRDLRERKTLMEQLADIFVALPGGFGTLEEMLEILTLKQLQHHHKPIVLVNTNGFYDRLLELFEHFYQQRFAKPEHRDLYSVAPDPVSALACVDSYRPSAPVSKWF